MKQSYGGDAQCCGPQIGCSHMGESQKSDAHMCEVPGGGGE